MFTSMAAGYKGKLIRAARSSPVLPLRVVVHSCAAIEIPCGVPRPFSSPSSDRLDAQSSFSQYEDGQSNSLALLKTLPVTA